jgi:IS5 family transposase
MGFEKYGRKSKREQFLDEMEQILPWAELQPRFDPHHPK